MCCHMIDVWRFLIIFQVARCYGIIFNPHKLTMILPTQGVGLFGWNAVDST